MKRYRYLLLLLVTFSFLASCTKTTDDGITLSKEVAPVLVTPDGSLTYVLTEENANNPFETFIYEKADFGTPIVVNYTIELEKVDGDFSNPEEMQEAVNVPYQTISVADFNLKLAAVGLTPGEQSVVKARVKATSSNESITTLYSNVVELKVTPYDATPPSLWIVGNATIAGWDPGASIEVKPISLTLYEGTADFTASPNEFRFLWQNTGWNPGLFYGDFKVVEGADAAPANEYGEVNFYVADGAGTYKIEIDIENKILKMTKQ